MEGPSLFLAAEQLAPLVGQKIMEVSGNTKIGKERLLKQKILAIFSYGKYLFFQFETFAMRVHFLLFGSFEATIKGIKVTGDYPKKARTPRLAFQCKNGHVELYSCSIRFIEESDARSLCDYTIDIMSAEFDNKKAYNHLQVLAGTEIADALLDQTLFLGVGNIIKNEVLHKAKVLPTRPIQDLSPTRLKSLIALTKSYVQQFYEWRKHFELRKHYQIYRQRTCKRCSQPVTKNKTGLRQRMSYVCAHCQK